MTNSTDGRFVQRHAPAGPYAAFVCLPLCSIRGSTASTGSHNPYAPSTSSLRAFLCRAHAKPSRSGLTQKFGSTLFQAESRRQWLVRKPPATARRSLQRLVAVQGSEASPVKADPVDDTTSKDVEDDPYKLLAQFKTPYNDVRVLEDSEGTRMLMLDDSGNVHSWYRPGKVLTNTYYDDLALVPGVVPDDGPIQLLGFGAGTQLRLFKQLWPGRTLLCWEIDPMLPMVAEDYFGIDPNDLLRSPPIIHIGDALNEDATVEGGFSAVIVDLFSDGEVVPDLIYPDTWRHIANRLRPGGRVIANIGYIENWGKSSDEVEAAIRNIFGEGLVRAVPGVYNSVILTGPPPDMAEWKAKTPPELHDRLEGWHPW